MSAVDTTGLGPMSAGSLGGAEADDPSFFEILDATERDEEGAVTARKIRIVASTIDGALPAGMSALDDPEYLLTVTGDGEVWAGLSYDKTTGVRSAPYLDKGASTPASTDTTKTRLLGGYSVPEDDAEPIAVNNVVFGPLTTSACRVWFSYPENWEFSWDS